MNKKQEAALRQLCERYKVEFNPLHYSPTFELTANWVAGWVGGSSNTLYVGVSPEGEISS